MEVWHEAFNLDFLSEFEFEKTPEATTVTNDAVVSTTDLQPHSTTPPISQQPQPIPAISNQEPEVQNNNNNATYYSETPDINNMLNQNNNNNNNNITTTPTVSNPLETPDKDETQLRQWHLIIDELNRYNWQQDSENRVKLIISHFESENQNNSNNNNNNTNNNNSTNSSSSNNNNIEVKPDTVNTENSSLQIKEETEQKLEWNTNSDVKLKMESNIISPNSSYLTMPTTYNSQIYNHSSSYLNLQRFKEEVRPVEISESNNSTMKNLMELDEMCSQIAAQNQESVINNSNNNIVVDWQEQNMLRNYSNLDKNHTITSAYYVENKATVPTTTTMIEDDYILDEFRDWEASLKDAANDTEETWSVPMNLDVNCMQQGQIWQQPYVLNNGEDMALLLSQLQSEHLTSAPSFTPSEVPEIEDMREQRLPDWNTAFGHTRPVSIEEEFTTQTCDLFYNKDSAQDDLCQVQSPVGVDLQPSPKSAETSYEENTESTVVSSPPITLPSVTPPPPPPITSVAMTSQLETTSSIIETTPEPENDNRINEPTTTAIPPPTVSLNTVEPGKKTIPQNEKPKRIIDPCPLCGKLIVNLSRHFLRVHNMKKVNGVFVPFNVYNTTPNITNDVIDNIISKEISVNVNDSIKNVVSGNMNTNVSPTFKNPIISSSEIPETTSNQSESNKNMNNCICALCNKVFKGKLSMEKHMKTIHKATQSILKCKKCSYTSVYPYIMKNHIIQKHTLKPSFMCIYCDLSYKGREGVKHHIKTKHHLNVAEQFGEVTLESVAKVINLCKSKCQKSPKKDTDEKLTQQKTCYTAIVPSQVNFLLPPSTIVSRVKDLCTGKTSKNVIKSTSKKTVLDNSTKNCNSSTSIEATLSNPNLTVSVIPSIHKRPTNLTNNNQSINETTTKSATGPKRKASTKSTTKNKRVNVSALTSGVSISLEIPQIASHNGIVVAKSTLPNVSLFTILNNDTIPISEMTAQTSVVEINNKQIKRKLSGTNSSAKKSKKNLAATIVNPDPIPSSNTNILPYTVNSSPFLPSISETSQSHSLTHDLNTEIESNTILSSNNLEEISYFNPENSIEIIDKLTEISTSNNNSEEVVNNCYSTIPDYILNSNEIQSYVINSPCPENPEPDSTSEIIDLSIPVTSINSYNNYIPSSLINKNEMLSSTCMSNINSPTVSFSNNDFNFLPIDYAKKHIDPLSPLSPPSSCLSPSVSVLPPSESCSSYTSIHSSEVDTPEADSQKETQSFTYNDPSSNHSSTTSSNNSNKAIDYSVTSCKSSKKGEYRCKNCYKRFNSQDELNIHKIDAHNNLEKPYSCTICSYKCAHTAYLKRHMKTHETFKCKYCSKKFIDQFLCESHEIAEHDDDEEEEEEEERVEETKIIKKTKKNQAQSEQKIKTIIDNIDDSNMIDWDNKICNICDSDFSNERDFYTHLYKYHLYTQYLTTQCLFCTKTISKKQYLRKHVKNVHKISFTETK